MIRMRIHLPDALYRDAKRLAEEHEITLAEVMRRGLEHMIRIYPPRDATTSSWPRPEPRHLGRFRAPEEQWRELANEGINDADPLAET